MHTYRLILLPASKQHDYRVSCNFVSERFEREDDFLDRLVLRDESNLYLNRKVSLTPACRRRLPEVVQCQKDCLETNVFYAMSLRHVHEQFFSWSYRNKSGLSKQFVSLPSWWRVRLKILFGIKKKPHYRCNFVRLEAWCGLQ